MKITKWTLLMAAVSLHMRVEAQTIQGRIIAEIDGNLLSQAHVTILAAVQDSVVASRLSADGLFAFHLPAAGAYRLRVQALGYTTLTTEPLDVPARTVITLDLRLRTDAIALEPLRVTAQRVEPPFMQDVRFRHRMGLGTLITREQLDDRYGSHLDEVIRDVGVKITYVPVKTGSQRMVPLPSGRQHSMRECFMSVFVNGKREYPSLGDSGGEDLERLWEVFRFRAQDIEAVEIFRGSAQVPGEFSDITSECGVVAFWLRDGYQTVSHGVPYTGPLPRITLHLTGTSYAPDGKHAPARGTAVEAASYWDIGRGIGVGVRLRHGRHALPADTVQAMMRLATAEQLSLITVGMEPRLVLLRQQRVRPVVAARLQLARRNFEVPYDYVDREANFVSWGWGWGGAVGAELAITRRIAIEAAASRERIHFGEYAGLETMRRHTATDWTITGVRVGVATRF